MKKNTQNQYLAPSVRLIPLTPARALASSFADGGEGLKYWSGTYVNEDGETPENL